MPEPILEEIIKDEYDFVKSKLAYWNNRLNELQNACSHPKEHVVTKYGANTGNYDPSADCYWTDNKCQLCGNWWREYE